MRTILLKREKNFIWEKFILRNGSFLLSQNTKRFFWIHVVYPLLDVFDFVTFDSGFKRM
ncbi:hypothetical protein LEP1GSC132_0773 [Leptospira kirschneri str. 200803703]|uniref:Uncharacterized protein n=2 Tax=Leptospira kirschneri TaxID=29507 RepID=A0A828XYE2_9LEPT|nr:hypothetical protein LEP1GSC044_0957 [Leptospira kirschneri serovar Grippotyphosa str. RM52]EKO50403.1 hypothetical protein LEP1GSC131_1157 [Leptospira kirschneri str. 200802841]EKP04108.1 hypothetical protein LEP1GSC018_4065 [Leptospira kirschneri str. 2008720114]EKQ84833.1 hypothetical protein LEP1GSC064_2993 [Leptospira kirschneri serovar Grippotyphosa str. Moskva]EKR07897.1 hypothetical protein LEP1GSC122_2018 [Leptospira kirschneri serovar Valbuzzi str. 200702274]EMJ94689.1 hypothetica